MPDRKNNYQPGDSFEYAPGQRAIVLGPGKSFKTESGTTVKIIGNEIAHPHSQWQEPGSPVIERHQGMHPPLYRGANETI